ncbi:MAG: hypothetical protein JSU88_10140 [Nitrospinaceae bacterium]|nr:MAG: hypothetical protein JSU88_10140 [Nitrospinaceae bacterium]
MKKIALYVSVLAISGLVAGAGPKPLGAGHEQGEILIVFSGNTLGELKPCGCAKEEDQGGIERRMSYLKSVAKRAKDRLLLDTGDSFKEPSVQGRLKASTLMEAMAAMNYDAVGLGDHDLVYGNRFLEEARGIPWISANMEIGKLVLAPHRIKQYPGGLKAAVVGLADPDLFYVDGHGNFKIGDPLLAARAKVAALKASHAPDLVVLLTHMNRDKAIELLGIEGVDVVINGHIENDTDPGNMTPVRRKGKILVQPGPRGQKMGELLVRIDPAGKKSFEHRMVRLDSSVQFDPEMVKLYAAYNEKVEALFFASLSEKRNNSDKEIYATEAVCKTCHPGAHKVWSESRHGRAYATLARVHKAFDPECLACHVMGWNQPGGFVSEVDTPELKNVQCEVCHGPGREHANAPAPGFGRKAQQACAGCHVKNHSPRFKYSDYWPKIKH